MICSVEKLPEYRTFSTEVNFKELSMAKNQSWVEECIEKARKSHPGVSEAVFDRLRELLTRKQCERALHGADIAIAAKALIADMATSSKPKAVINHED